MRSFCLHCSLSFFCGLDNSNVKLQYFYKLEHILFIFIHSYGNVIKKFIKKCIFKSRF